MDSPNLFPSRSFADTSRLSIRGLSEGILELRVLLLAGLGPSFKDDDYLQGTLFDIEAAKRSEEFYRKIARGPITLNNLHYERNGRRCQLLRTRRGLAPNLTAQTLHTILTQTGIAHDLFDLEDLWARREPTCQSYDVVALSTTFICNFQTLSRALEWITAHFGHTTIVLGGQFSNLKYRKILEVFPFVNFIIRGDAEEAFPQLLRAIDEHTARDSIPNLVWRDPASGTLHVNQVSYIDLENHPSPKFYGPQPVVPYESMRGCPFGCKFCSYPSASPQWRAKSAEKVCRDWKNYASDNGANLVKCMDSTFTIPPARFSKLLETLPEIDIEWEAYARANAIMDAKTVEALEKAHCRSLSIGFESMNNNTLSYMGKGISSGQNLQAFKLMAGSDIELRGSFMVGYPGETPEDYNQTHQFLVNDFAGQFRLSVFSLLDETMPIWDEAPRFQLKVQDPQEPNYAWQHCGMDAATARQLQERTIYEVRWKNDKAVLALWQGPYEEPLIPGLSHQQNNRLEKLVERLAFLPKDFAPSTRASSMLNTIGNELISFGVELC
jgi:hypothetical protein